MIFSMKFKDTTFEVLENVCELFFDVLCIVKSILSRSCHYGSQYWYLFWLMLVSLESRSRVSSFGPECLNYGRRSLLVKEKHGYEHGRFSK